MKKLQMMSILLVLMLLTGCLNNTMSTEHGKENERQHAIKDNTEQEEAVNKANQEENTEVSEKLDNIQWGIQTYPKPFDFNRGTLVSLPPLDNNKKSVHWQMDLRSYDLRSIDLKDSYDKLKLADFDDCTIWPQQMPVEYDPKTIMELGADPGLNIRELHKKGITGKGVSVAIIDQPLLVDHEDIDGKVTMYEEYNLPKQNDTALMHGNAVSSILMGTKCGVAPEAKLYYLAISSGHYKVEGFEYDFSIMADGIRRILEVNKSLPDDEKIRVIAIQLGWNSEEKGYDDIINVIEEAKENNVFVISSSIADSYEGLYFNGLGRDILKDPNDCQSYEPGLFWKEYFYKSKGKSKYSKKPLLVPMDSRTTASPTGKDEYVFYRSGGFSWAIPYIAGVYTLACQVEPEITPEIFWKKALETGDTIEVSNGDATYELGLVVNPPKLIESIQSLN